MYDFEVNKALSEWLLYSLDVLLLFLDGGHKLRHLPIWSKYIYKESHRATIDRLPKGRGGFMKIIMR